MARIILPTVLTWTNLGEEKEQHAVILNWWEKPQLGSNHTFCWLICQNKLMSSCFQRPSRSPCIYSFVALLALCAPWNPTHSSVVSLGHVNISGVHHQEHKVVLLIVAVWSCLKKTKSRVGSQYPFFCHDHIQPIRCLCYSFHTNLHHGTVKPATVMNRGVTRS